MDNALKAALVAIAVVFALLFAAQYAITGGKPVNAYTWGADRVAAEQGD